MFAYEDVLDFVNLNSVSTFRELTPTESQVNKYEYFRHFHLFEFNIVVKAVHRNLIINNLFCQRAAHYVT